MIHPSKLVLALLSACFLAGCGNDDSTAETDATELLLDAGKADDASAKHAIITGHILHRDVYPDRTEIQITLPFVDRVAQKMTSPIWEDDTFAFELLPYAPRSISMPPFVDHLLISPGDSLHIELDFADFNHVEYSGRGSENNGNLNRFHMQYYTRDWPSHSSESEDGIPSYGTAADYAKAARQRLDTHLERLQDFIAEAQPSPELVQYCRREIETDYYAGLARAMGWYQLKNGEDITGLFSVQDTEYLYDGQYLNGNLFDLTESIHSWQIKQMSAFQRTRFSKDLALYVDWLKETSGNELLTQMLITFQANEELEENSVDRFEEDLALFVEKVVNPLLRQSIRERYLFRKSYQQHPEALSNVILNAASDHDDVTVKKNEGVTLLKDIISRSGDSVIYVCIGAHWCPGSIQEKPYRDKLTNDYRGQALHIVNLYLDSLTADDLVLPDVIENHQLTDAERMGMDFLFHLGRGIPFYILIDKNGVIVDYGNHLRPSSPITRERIDHYLGQQPSE